MGYQNLDNVGVRSVRWEPDALFNSYWINKLIGIFVKNGKRQRAEKLVFGAIEKFKGTFKKASFYLFFMKTLRELRPVIGLGRRRLGLVMIDTPYAINSTRGIKIVLRWIVDRIKSQPERSIKDRLSSTLLILNNPRLRYTMLRTRYDYMIGLQESTRYTHFRWA